MNKSTAEIEARNSAFNTEMEDLAQQLSRDFVGDIGLSFIQSPGADYQDALISFAPVFKGYSEFFHLPVIPVQHEGKIYPCIYGNLDLKANLECVYLSLFAQCFAKLYLLRREKGDGHE